MGHPKPFHLAWWGQVHPAVACACFMLSACMLTWWEDIQNLQIRRHHPPALSGGGHPYTHASCWLPVMPQCPGLEDESQLQRGVGVALPRGTRATACFTVHLKSAIPSNLQSLFSPPLSPPGNPLLYRNLTFLHPSLFSRSAASFPSPPSYSAWVFSMLSLSLCLCHPAECSCSMGVWRQSSWRWLLWQQLRACSEDAPPLLSVPAMCPKAIPSTHSASLRNQQDGNDSRDR